MKTLKLIQILFIASSFTACTGGKNRSKRAEVAKQANTQKPMERKQNGTQIPPVEPSSPPSAQRPPVVAAKPPAQKTEAQPSDVPSPAVVPVKKETLPAVSKEKTVEIAADSKEIKDAEKQAKISFKNFESLKNLSSKADMVIMEGAHLSRDEAMKKLIAGGENHFCQVKGLEKFNEKDFLKLVDGANEVVDEENDLYNSKLSFENKNGRMELDCTHTNKRFLVQELRINFKELLTVYDQNGALENSADYVNPYTEKRKRSFFKLSQVDALEKVKYDENMKSGFALVNGKLVEGEEAIKNVNEGKALHACVLMQVTGKLDNQKLYGLRTKPEMLKGSQTSPVIVVSYSFNADRENGFVIYCNQTKTSTHDEISKALEGLIKYETLERKEYNKKIKELVQIQEAYQKALEEKKK